MQEELRDNSQRSRDASLVFIALACISGISILLLIYQSYQLKNYTNTEEYLSTIQLLDVVIPVAYIIQFLVNIAAIVFFIRWFKRAYGNLIRKHQPTESSENGAAWGFFIPILFFYRPVTNAKEIFLKTQYAIREYNSNLKVDTDTSFITVWWILYWVNSFFANYASNKREAAFDISTFVDANGYMIISEVVTIIATLCVLYLIYKVTKVETLLRETNESVSEIDEIGKVTI
ncbi:DUF4328 domain-containing protein [Kordia sp.]|uniref:DUF4328 domain-containing protein n=1 Tax=Kordia sp. TaxID=1965332 RepID=UPI003B5995AF